MVEDAFFRSLQADWRSSSADLGSLRRRVERRRRLAALQLLAEAAGGVLGLAAGGWFLVRALQDGQLLYGLAAAALLAATALTLVSVRRARRDLAGRADATARGLLLQMAFDARSAKQGLRRLRWSAWLLMAATLGVWLLWALGSVDGAQAGRLSLAWTGTALALLGWTLWRRRRLDARERTCDRLLQEIDEEVGPD